MFTFTEEDLFRKFRHYNDKYFGGALPIVRIEKTNTRGRFGCFKPYEALIEISDYYVRDEANVNQTLVHEMIHLWQWVAFKKCDHGATFKKKAAAIAKVGKEFNITRCNQMVERVAKEEKKEWVKLVQFDYEGKTWCCRPCVGKEEKFKWFEGKYGVSNVKVIKAYGDFPWTRCSTRLHFSKDITGSVDSFYKDHKVIG